MDAIKPDIHPGNAKRLSALVDDYVMTMQHAIRQDLKMELEQRAVAEAGVLPPLSAAEMFDYLMDTDVEFLNWCFPFCAVRLSPDNMSYLHKRIITDYRKSLNPLVLVDEPELEPKHN